MIKIKVLVFKNQRINHWNQLIIISMVQINKSMINVNESMIEINDLMIKINKSMIEINLINGCRRRIND